MGFTNETANLGAFLFLRKIYRASLMTNESVWEERTQLELPFPEEFEAELERLSDETFVDSFSHHLVSLTAQFINSAFLSRL